MILEYFVFIMFFVMIVVLLFGFFVVLMFGGLVLLFVFIGEYFDLFNIGLFLVYFLRILGVMKVEMFVVVFFFIFMGVMFDCLNLVGDLFDVMGWMFGKMKGGFGVFVLIVGILFVVFIGIVGVIVVIMGLMSYLVMMWVGYDLKFVVGFICFFGMFG